jgi:hypothetical protein
MKQIFKGIKIVAVLFLALAFVSCDEDDAVLPQVEAGFTYTLNQGTGTVVFINTSTNADDYTWDLGDGTNSPEINPIKSYPPGVYTVVLEASNVSGDSDTFEDTIVVLDVDIPLITLIGDASINVTLDDAFTDPGATAIDNVDGDLTAVIVVGGDTVDTSLEDSYTITYDVTDAQGNEAEQVTRTVVVSAIVCTLDTAQSFAASSFNLTFSTDPGTTTTVGTTDALFLGDVGYEWVNNPDAASDINTSCKVAKIDKIVDVPFGNTQIFTADKFNFTDNAGFKLKVFSPSAGVDILLKLEDTNAGGTFNEVSQSTTVDNGWEELTFDFPEADTNKFDRIIIFFGFNQAAALTIHFDELKVYPREGGACTPDAAQSFAASSFNLTLSADPGTTTTVGTTEAFFTEDVGYEYVDNQDFDNAINNTCKVARIDKPADRPFANLQIFTVDKFNFTDNAGFKLKVFSPSAGVDILLKLEDTNAGGIFNEISQSTTVDNGWEELTFNFPEADTNKFDRMIIFFGFNQGAALNIDFDELKVYPRDGGGGGGGGGSCPAPPAGNFISDGDFEANAGCWGLFDVNTTNGGLTTISTTVSNGGGTNSGQIETEAFGNPGIKQERFGAGTILPNTTYVVNFDIKADASDPLADGAVLNVLAFSEPADGSGLPAGLHPLLQGDASVATTWAARSYTFTTGSNVDGGVSLLFELVCGGAAACGGTINIDNVSMTAQ